MKPGEAHVWYLWPDQVTDSACIEMHERILSDEERSRVASFRFDRHKRDHLLTRAFVRRLLAQYAGVKPEDLQFARNPHGKPELSGPPGVPSINFNISHTTGLITCLLAHDATVGIDVENLRSRIDTEIADRYFSEFERADLRRLTNEERQRRFLEYWTLKEAYIKALGFGLSMDLSRFGFRIHEHKIQLMLDSDDTEDPRHWQFHLLWPSADHVVAAAIKTAETERFRLETRDGTKFMATRESTDFA